MFTPPFVVLSLATLCLSTSPASAALDSPWCTRVSLGGALHIVLVSASPSYLRYFGLKHFLLLQLRTVPGAHELVWVVSFISFFFLYPSTFNLLEVAAVDKPQVHMWETGIMRITRHPQVSR
jgi:uncharacterized membrane protein